MECLRQLHSVGKKTSHIFRDVFISSPLPNCAVDDSLKEVTNKTSSNKNSNFFAHDFVPSFRVNIKPIEPILSSSVSLQKCDQVVEKGSSRTTSNSVEGVLLPVSSGGELNFIHKPLDSSSTDRQYWMSIQISLDYRHSLSLQLLGDLRQQKNEKLHFCRHLIRKITDNPNALAKGTTVTNAEEPLNENYRFSLLLVSMMMNGCQEDGISHNTLKYNRLFGEGVSGIRLRSHQRFVRHYCPTRSTMPDNELGSSCSSSLGRFIEPPSVSQNRNPLLLCTGQDEFAAIIDVYLINVDKLSTLTSLLEGDDLFIDSDDYYHQFLQDSFCSQSRMIKSFSKPNNNNHHHHHHDDENNDMVLGLIDERIILGSSYLLELAEDAACTLSVQSFVLLTTRCPF